MNNLKKDNSSRHEKELLDEVSTAGNFSLFVIYCLLIIYAAITVYSTTDLVLLMPASTVLLPILETKITLPLFFGVAPLLVVILHFYLLHRREGYEKKIKDGKKRKESWPPNFFGIEPEERERGVLLLFFANVMCFFGGPLCLFYIQLRFSNFQSFWISFWHFILLFVVAITLCRNKEVKFSVPCGKLADKEPNDKGSIALLTWDGVLAFIRKIIRRSVVLLVSERTSMVLRKSISFFVLLIGFVNFLTVGMLHSKTSTDMLAQWKIKIDREKGQEENYKLSTWIKERPLWLIPKITFPSGLEKINLDLSKRRLMFADLKNNDMAKIKLGGAYLQGADMRGAKLQDADMSWAKLQGANMRWAKLQGADLMSAQLQGADMGEAKLQGADLMSAELQSADMRGAKLQGADLMLAQLQGANMLLAELQGADLNGAQMQGADMKEAKMQGADLECLELTQDDIRCTQLQGADLRGAQLQGAHLRGAQLQGADLRGAQLQGTYIRKAKFQGADTENTAFHGSFCKPRIRGGFFDRVNGRIGKQGLEECNLAAWGVLWEDTADEIIEDLRKNKTIPPRIIKQVQKRMMDRVRRTATVKEDRKGELTSDNACAIIKNWEENVKDVPQFNDAVTNWLNTTDDINLDLRKCLYSR